MRSAGLRKKNRGVCVGNFRLLFQIMPERQGKGRLQKSKILIYASLFVL